MRRAVIKFLALGWMLSVYIVLTLTFLLAYSNPSKTVTVAINNYNEATAELFLLLGGFVLVLLGSMYFFSDSILDFRQRLVSEIMEELEGEPKD